MEEATTRNNAVYEAYQNGVPLSELAEWFGVCSERIRSICEREEMMRKRKTDPLYQAIEKQTEDIQLIVKTFNVLNRHHIESLDQVRNLSDADMKQMRHCGPVMRNLLKRL